MKIISSDELLKLINFTLSKEDCTEKDFPVFGSFNTNSPEMSELPPYTVRIGDQEYFCNDNNDNREVFDEIKSVLYNPTIYDNYKLKYLIALINNTILINTLEKIYAQVEN